MKLQSDIHLTEEKAKHLNFEFVKNFDHDEWRSARYKKGIIEIDFTYITETGELEGFDISIDEVVGKDVTIEQLKQLDQILNQS